MMASHRSLRRASAFVAGLALAAGLDAGATAQQFVYQNGLIPGQARWTEGVECGDVDNDGDLDIFFADGGGFSTPGTQYTNTLVINGLVPSGSLSFTNEGAARLGSAMSHAKNVTTGDIDNDGWLDALFANAFNTDPPHLYHNRGAAQPGFFDLESAARGLTEALSSAYGEFGDADDDGDLDLIMCDSGNSYLGAPGGKPRYYVNDGNGNFTEQAAMMAAPTKQAHMVVHFTDIDNDQDLDFFGANRASNGGINHYLILNNGAGNFSEDASNRIPSMSSNVYEGEAGDLDNDGDIDFFFISLSGFNDGPVINNLIPSGNLTFSAGTPLSGDDDNEVALFDYDSDGDYDAYIGSLDFAGPDKILQNNGSAVFSVANVIQSVPDSTLDCTVADLDNDGDYDLITAQGESNQAQWVNKVYLNNGPKDTRPPVVTSTDFSMGGSGLVAHANVRDQVLDNCRNWVSGCVEYVSNATPVTHDIVWDGTAFSPPLVNANSGDVIRWTDTSGLGDFLAGTSAPYLGLTLALPANGSVSFRVVVPGTLDYLSGFTLATGSASISGTTSKVNAFYMAGQRYRAVVPGSGTTCWAWRFTDWAGNVTVADGDCTSLNGPLFYCTPKTSSAGCVASLSTTTPFLPTSGAGGYSVDASAIQGGKNGLLFAGISGQAAIPFAGGTLCVNPPNKRGPIMNSGGTGPNTCDGAFSTEINDGNIIPFGLDAGSGNTGWYQYWYRDPNNGAGTLGTALSAGVEVDFL